MFYVSDINGVLVPYEEAEVERIRAHQLRAQELELARLAAQEPSQQSPGATSVPVIDPKAPAVGLAGASAMYRGAGATEGSEQGEQARTSGLRSRANRPPVSQVRPAAALKPGDKRLELDEEGSGKTNPYEKLDEPLQKRKKAILASQIMSSPVHTFTKDMTVEQARELFRKHRFRHMPVTSENKRLVGIFSDRDCLQVESSDLKVGEVMTTDVLSARPNTEIRKIADLLFQERIGAMPIVDEKEELVGIITRSDILCAVVNKAPLDLWI